MKAGGRCFVVEGCATPIKIGGVLSWGAELEDGRVRLVGRTAACASVLVRAAVPPRCQLSC